MGRRRRRRNCKPHIKDDTREQVISLLKWLRLKNNFKVVSFPHAGRGVLTKRNILKDDELAAVPLKFMMTLDDATIHSEVAKLSTKILEDTQTALAVFLLYQRHLGALSFHFHYLNMLPKDYSTLWYCSDIEKKALPSWMLRLLSDRIRNMESQFDIVLQSIDGLMCNHCGCPIKTLMSYEDFQWAWTTVNTRAVYYESMNSDKGKKAAGEMALAPFLDIFNHSSTADVEVTVDRDRSVYILKTRRSFKKNEQVFIKYGAHSNLALLLEYGFVLDCLDQDAVEFTFEDVLQGARLVDESYGDVTKLKYKFIKGHHLNENLTKSKDGFSWNCEGLLYILVTRDSDLSNLLTKTYSATLEKNEKGIVDRIKTIMIKMKMTELAAQLAELDAVVTQNPGFNAAKILLKQYVTILEM